MPLVQISIPADSLSRERKALMIKKVTDAVVEAEGVPVRAATIVHILEVPDGGWGRAGNVITLEELKATYQK